MTRLDLDSVVATFTDGSRGSLSEDVTEKIGGITWVELADDEQASLERNAKVARFSLRAPLSACQLLGHHAGGLRAEPGGHRARSLPCKQCGVADGHALR